MTAADVGAAGEPDGLALLEDVRWRGTRISGERLQALLAVLAHQPTRVVADDRIVDEVWGADVPANPTKALQVLVSRTRAQTSPDLVVRNGHGYRLGDLPLDVSRLREQAAAAHRALAAGDAPAARDLARTVVSRLVAAPGDADPAPLAELRRAARDEVARCREVLGRALVLTGEHADALMLLEPLVAARPDDDLLLEALLRSEAAVRGVPAALERYERHRRLLRDTLGADPAPALRRLHAELLARDRPVREGLLHDATRLIGREEDVKALSALVATSRVTSILGAGGLGKTRLAHLMGRLAEQPVVHFVELAGVTSPDGVAVEVGSALGVRDSISRRPLLDAAQRADLHARIVDRLDGAPTLLILDNCEHLVEAVADLVGVLVSRTAQLRVLTTTRAPLGLAAERVYPLPQLGTSDAVELFRERATAARPGVRLDDDRVRALVERLDGLPLAVELAAAKVRAMSVEEIERRLENRFALLRGGSRDAPERHQTLLAVIDWSWNLLAVEERVALRRLSVFRDGFSLAAADEVVATDDVLDAVAQLVDQSLVTIAEDADGAVRYRLLETVREFGRMQLVDAGDDAATDERLRRWAIGQCAVVMSSLYGPDQIEALRSLRVEEGNLTDVLRRCLADGDAESVIRLMASLSTYWTIQGEHLKVLNVLPAVEDCLTEATVSGLDEELRLVLSSSITNAMIFTGALHEPSLAWLRQLGPGDEPRTRGMVRVLLRLAEAWSAGKVDALEDLCDDAEPDTARVARMWSCQARENAGDMKGAFRAAYGALELCDDADGPWARAMVTSQLAGLAVQTDDMVAARRYAEEALPIMRSIGAQEDALQLKALLAVADMRGGRVVEAERMLSEIAADEQNESVFGGLIVIRCGVAELALVRGEIDEGLALYRDAVESLRHRGLPGLDMRPGFEPWLLYPAAGALAAHAVHRPEQGHDLHRELQGKAPTLLDTTDNFVDYPVTGSVLFALGLFDIATGREPKRAVRVLAVAHAFAFNRMLPSLSWEVASRLADEAVPGELAAQLELLEDTPAVELRDDVRLLLEELDR